MRPSRPWRAYCLAFVAWSASVIPSCAEPEKPEPLIVKDTRYPIPHNAIFVSPAGDDRNGGTRTGPLRTISEAVNRAPSGGTIVMRQGTFREALPDLSKRLTIQSYPHEQVWLKGSALVSGWTRDGNAWKKENWSFEFCDDCFSRGTIDPSHPHAGLPDQVFLDGVPLRQVVSRNAVRTGTFYVDDQADLLLIGSDPRGRAVEASVHSTALNIWRGAEGTIIRGLGFAHYSPVAEPGLGGTVKANAADLTFENNTFAWSAVKGLVVFAPDNIVRGNTFIHNGMMGLGAWRADGLQVTGNRFAFNNQQGFVRSGAVSEAAGAKLTSSRNITITDNIFEGNLANGLWLDINISNAEITRNIVKNNQRHGIFYEISSNAILASNLVIENGLAGIALSNATGIRVYNNTLVGNTFALVVQDDDRVNYDLTEIEEGNTWISGDTSFHNNLVAGKNKTQDAAIWVRDFSVTLDADDMLTSSDNNGYLQPADGKRRRFAEWWRRTGQHIHADVEIFRLATGRDVNSIVIENERSDPIFVDRRSGNYNLRPDSVAKHAGSDLPRAVAKAIGITDRQSPDLGALLFPHQ